MSRLQRDIFPVLGRKIVSTITRKDVRFTIQEIASRGAINLAGRALNMINQILIINLIIYSNVKTMWYH